VKKKTDYSFEVRMVLLSSIKRSHKFLLRVLRVKKKIGKESELLLGVTSCRRKADLFFVLCDIFVFFISGISISSG